MGAAPVSDSEATETTPGVVSVESTAFGLARGEQVLSLLQLRDQAMCLFATFFRTLSRSRVPPLLGDFGAPSSLMSRKWPFESRLAVPQMEVTAAFFHAKGACLDLSSLSTRLTTICLRLSLEPCRSMKGHRGRGSRGYRGLPWRAITDGSFHGRLSCATCVCFCLLDPSKP